MVFCVAGSSRVLTGLVGSLDEGVDGVLSGERLYIQQYLPEVIRRSRTLAGIDNSQALRWARHKQLLNYIIFCYKLTFTEPGNPWSRKKKKAFSYRPCATDKH